MPHPAVHLHPAYPGPVAPDPVWEEWSRSWTRHLPTLTGRTDLTIRVAPGAGGGAPACFYPDLARVEIDAVHLGNPTAANPRRAAHRRLVPTAYGLLVHEAAHAVHSRWRAPATTPAVVAEVADLLEESRAEYRHRTRRRGDRRWLRHTVATLIDPDDAPVDDTWHAATLAGLLLARVDARILTAKQTRGVRTAITAVLGRQRLAALREIWRAAHSCADTDADTMIDLAWQWCRLLDIDPHSHPHVPVVDAGVFAGRLAAALTDYLAATAAQTPGQYEAARIAARHQAPATWTRRDPTPGEQHAARTLAARLRRARTRHPEPTRTPAPTPPGRLRTRHAITADAQRAAGMLPTSQPWQRRTAAPPPAPRLHLAVLIDVSGSMTGYTGPLSSAAWILAHAARRAEATTATIAFSGTVTLVTPPRNQPTHVLEMGAFGGSSAFCQATKLADQLLDLRHRNGVRMLAVLSDGDLDDTAPAQKLITTLHHTGCAVLWLQPAGMPGHTFTHTTTLTVTDPVDAIDQLTAAAITALAGT